MADENVYSGQTDAEIAERLEDEASLCASEIDRDLLRRAAATIVAHSSALKESFARGRIEGLREALVEAEQARSGVYAGLVAEQRACEYIRECIRADMHGRRGSVATPDGWVLDWLPPDAGTQEVGS